MQKKTVFESLCNKDYIGEIKKGNTLKIATINNPEVKDYTKGGTITYDEIGGTDQTIEINQQKYFAFKCDDISAVQSNIDLLASTTAGAGYELADEMDQFIATTVKTNGTAKTITGDSYLEILADVGKILDDEKAPDGGRWLVMPTAFSSALMLELAGKFTNNTDIVTSGYVGTVFGLNLFKSVNVTKPLYGHQMAVTLANQIDSTESIRLQNSFATGIRGLHVYGAKVTRPKLCGEITATIGE